MPEIFTLDVLDEFSYEMASQIVPATREALSGVEDLILVQDGSCEYCVTLTGDQLTLWNPEHAWADQAKRRFGGSLEDAVKRAAMWLAAYLEVEVDAIEILLDAAEFH